MKKTIHFVLKKDLVCIEKCSHMLEKCSPYITQTIKLKMCKNKKLKKTPEKINKNINIVNKKTKK